MLHSLEAGSLGPLALTLLDLGLGLVNHTILQSCIYVCLGDVRVSINIMNV